MKKMEKCKKSCLAFFVFLAGKKEDKRLRKDVYEKILENLFIAVNNDFNNILISLLLKMFRDGTIYLFYYRRKRVFCERIDDIRKLSVERFVLRMGGSQSFKYQATQSKLWEKKRRACKLSTVRGK